MLSAKKNIAEELILPAALDMVSVMLDDASAAKIKLSLRPMTLSPDV